MRVVNALVMHARRSPPAGCVAQVGMAPPKKEVKSIRAVGEDGERSGRTDSCKRTPAAKERTEIAGVVQGKSEMNTQLLNQQVRALSLALRRK